MSAPGTVISFALFTSTVWHTVGTGEISADQLVALGIKRVSGLKAALKKLSYVYNEHD